MRLLPRMLGVEAQIGIRMKDFGEWKPVLNQTGHVLPRRSALLTATLYHSEPAFAHLKPKALETGEVSRNGMLVEVAFLFVSVCVDRSVPTLDLGRLRALLLRTSGNAQEHCLPCSSPQVAAGARWSARLGSSRSQQSGPSLGRMRSQLFVLACPAPQGMAPSQTIRERHGLQSVLHATPHAHPLMTVPQQSAQIPLFIRRASR
jgi:hypothetical protein